MSHIHDDAMLTAYALGELEGAERAEMEARVSACAECRREVEAARATAGVVAAELRGEAGPGLKPEQRRAIEARAGRHEPAAWMRRAAGLLLVAGISAVLALPSHNKVQQAPAPPPVAVPQENLGAGRDNVFSGPAPLCAPVQTASGNPPVPQQYDARDLVEIPRNDPGDPSATCKTLQPAATYAPPAAEPVDSGRKPYVGVGGQIYGGLTTAAGGAPAPRSTQVAHHEEWANLREFARPTIAMGGGGNNPGLKFDSEDKGRSTAAYDRIVDNAFQRVSDHPLSTFSIDVDTASYSNLRRFLQSGQLPPKDAVRIEEMLNYFHYDYPKPKEGRPFSVTTEVSACPWAPPHRLVRIGLKGKEIDLSKRPPSNLVFLIDVSGSMMPSERLPLIKSALPLLVDQLDARDRVAIAVYAGNSGLVLPSTPCDAEGKKAVLASLARLEAGGSTNGGEGIQLAYKVAAEHFIPGGTNRVIWCTDGDLNVGVTDQGGLTRLIEEKAKTKVFLTALGVGTDNLKDSTLQKVADQGNGNYAYLDSLNEAKKVLVEQMSGTLMTIAKDVKIQVEFNPAKAGSYRLIGYEKRLLRKEDFNDDRKDAGEIGSGHTVTALYEVAPPGEATAAPGVDPLKYQAAPPVPASSPELLTVKLRYKEPEGDKSALMEAPVTDEGRGWEKASGDFHFAAAVASFGMLLRDSEHKGNATYDGLLSQVAVGDMGRDEGGWRTEFVELVKTAKKLQAGK